MPPVDICRLARSCWGWLGRYGYEIRSTAGWVSRNVASCRAVSLCWRTHVGSVRIPLIAFQASKGDACAPIAVCQAQMGSMRSALPATTPRRASLWPAIPLVAECRTRSTPCSRGRCTTGVAKVESTTVMGPGMAATACEVHEGERGVGRRLHEDQLRATGDDRGGDRIDVRPVDERDVDAEARQVHGEQRVGHREDLAGGHDVVALGAQAEHDRR